MIFFIFVFGLITGSFLNAVIHRLHSGQSLVFDSSRCPNCNHKLSASDLIPVISFFLLGRRCQYCKKSISWQYPAVELAAGAAFVLIYFSAQGGSASGGQFPISNFQFWFQLVFACFLIIIFVYDLKHYLILDKILFPAIILAAIYQIWQGDFLSGLVGVIALSGFFGLLYLISRGRWIGFGDVKLGIFLGFLVPWPETLVLFLLAYLLGALTSIILIAWGGKKLSDRLPFGTFLTLSGFLAMLWGEELLNWYLNLIGFG